MTETASLARWLAESWEDQRLSRGEKRTIAALVGSGVAGPDIRTAAFAHARAIVGADPSQAIDALAWLEDVAKATLVPAASEAAVPPPAAAPGAASEVWFAPHMEVCARIVKAFDAVRTRADVCVFTITDDRISRAIEAAHRRGVKVRVVTDNLKSEDLGSDIERLARAGMAVRVDRTEAHMHHKFVLLDGVTLLNGSYNWTRSAGLENSENLVVTSDAAQLTAFAAEFERVWARAEAY